MEKKMENKHEMYVKVSTKNETKSGCEQRDRCIFFFFHFISSHHSYNNHKIDYVFMFICHLKDDSDSRTRFFSTNLAMTIFSIYHAHERWPLVIMCTIFFSWWIYLYIVNTEYWDPTASIFCHPVCLSRYYIYIYSYILKPGTQSDSVQLKFPCINIRRLEI